MMARERHTLLILCLRYSGFGDILRVEEITVRGHTIHIKRKIVGNV